ncbi:hypothetical protein [Litchfieldella rifensis]|uniref:Peptidase C-terminal archaeal/bacterial domain-containing protein n=1 Tax=Litchfieldella rifensis TaxID=762643 RepID=A0ABV7LKG8_9GAMM
MPTTSTPRVLFPLATLSVGLVIGWFAADRLGNAAPTDTSSVESEPLTLEDTYRGEITSASGLNANDGSRFERLTLALEADTLVELELGGVLNGTLALYDDEGSFLTASPDDGMSARLHQRIAHDGNYILAVSGRDRHSYGPFRITGRPLETRDSGPLTLDDPVHGWLQDDANAYDIEIQQAGLYRIEMRSDDLDAYLALSGPGGMTLEDDDSGGDLDAQLSGYLEAGHYQLEARTVQSQGRGLYTLALTTRDLPGGIELQHGGDLLFDQPLHGWYSGESLEYRLDIAEPTLVNIDMLSDDLDAYLEVSGNNITLDNDDGGDGYNARIHSLLSPGTYTVKAKGYGGSDTGLFTLQAAASDLADTDNGVIEIGSTVAGQLNGGSHDYYRFRVEQAGQYTIEMTSSTVDAYLVLQGNGLFVEDDDGGGDYDARIQTYLEPGDYHVIARSFDTSEGGPYRLGIRPAGAML